MDENLLVERLKKAKKELTALKTAHRRGAAGLILFEINQAGTHQNWLLRFNRDYPPYPYVCFSLNATTHSLVWEDGGYTLRARGYLAKPVVSSAPIISIEEI